jgi:hypothetical protein|tara:strand:- start:273 stop:542 length:270 start_codon:yes stop_codon:yes gene_type:complete
MPVSKEFKRANALIVRYRHPREGPPSYLVWEPEKSYICLTREELLKAVRWPKFTSTGAALRQWIEEVEEQIPPEPHTTQLKKIEGGLED